MGNLILVGGDLPLLCLLSSSVLSALPDILLSTKAQLLKELKVPSLPRLSILVGVVPVMLGEGEP